MVMDENSKAGCDTMKFAMSNACDPSPASGDR
jgi:hypothetical protein